MKRILLSTLTLAAIGTTAMAQWTRTNGPEGIIFAALAADDSMVVGSTLAGGILRHAGAVWEEMDAPPLYDLVLTDRQLFARGLAGQYFSRDYGKHWKALPFPGTVVDIGGLPFMMLNDSLYNWKSDREEWELAGAIPGMMKPVAYKSSLYALAGAARDTLMRSSDRGHTWMSMASDIAGHGNEGRFIVAGPDAIYAAWHTGEIYRSTDDGATWRKYDDGIATDHGIDWILSNATTVWAGNYQTIYRLNDGRWDAFPVHFLTNDPVVTEDGIVMSTPEGPAMIGNAATAPTSLTPSLRKLDIVALGTIGSVVTASSWNATYRSGDGGDHWTKTASVGMARFAAAGDVMLAITNEGYRSIDSGATWEPLTPKLDGSTNLQSLLATPDAIYIGHGDRFFGDENEYWSEGGVYRSTDRGLTWTAANVGLPVRNNETAPVVSLAATEEGVMALTPHGVHISRNRGERWYDASVGLPRTIDYGSGTIAAMGGSVYLFTTQGMFRTENNGERWTPIGYDIPPGLVLATLPTILDGRIYMQVFEMLADGTQKPHTYAFDGRVWEDATASMPPGIFFTAYAPAGNTLYAGSRANSVWRQSTPLSVPGDHTASATVATVRPNPSSGRSMLGLTLEGRAHVTVTIVDARGEEVGRISEGDLEKGSHDLPMETGSLPAGAYFVRIVHDGITTTAPFVKR